VTYKIPDSFGSRVTGRSSPELPVTAFEGGHGNGRAQFNNARAIATDSAGNIFVADGGNGRVQKFSATGAFVTSMQPFEAPSGIAVDRAGNIYVAEIGTKHCVQKLGPNGISIAKWVPGLYGPRKIAIGPDDSIYVVDSGRNRIVKLSSDGQVLASWGSEGSGDGQFRAVSSVTVDPSSNKVFVADPVNSRVQVFDSNGKFLSKWAVPEWREPLGFEDLAIDPQRGRLYASSAHQSTIVVFDLQGNRLGTVMPTPPEKLEAPSALALAKGNLLVLDADSGRVFLIPLWNR
jgi:DNA-binding beta-propeller fold protein YncE